MSGASDFERDFTADTLVLLARKFKSKPCVIYRGVTNAPLFHGGAETPTYRRSSDPSDRGKIITT